MQTQVEWYQFAIPWPHLNCHGLLRFGAAGSRHILPYEPQAQRYTHAATTRIVFSACWWAGYTNKTTEANKDSNWGNERVVKPGDGESEVDLPTELFLNAARDRIQKGKKYRYQVAAVTVAGTSPWSEASNEIKIPTKLEFIVISADRKKAKKLADAAAKKKKKEEDAKGEQKT